MRAVRDALVAELIAVDRMLPLTGAAGAQPSKAVEVLERGGGLGFPDDRLRAFLGRGSRARCRASPVAKVAPGLNLIEHWVPYARCVFEQERALRPMQWPAAFRYRGPAGQATFEGGSAAARRLPRDPSRCGIASQQASSWTAVEFDARPPRAGP